MATSSITKTFIVEGKEQVEKFANAIEDAYQDSLKRGPVTESVGVVLHGEEARAFARKSIERLKNAQ